MELRRYLEIAARRWLVVVIAFAVTTAMTLVFVLGKPATYKASGTYVVRPRLLLEDEDAARAFDAQARSSEINATYASIARSELIRNRAEDRLPPGSRSSGMSVAAEVVTGTNVLTISVRGRDPEGARDLAVAIGAETVAHIEESQQTYQLEPLDLPEVPKKPVDSKKELTIAGGVILGALLGIALAALVEYLSAQLRMSGGRNGSSELDTPTSAGLIDGGANPAIAPERGIGPPTAPAALEATTSPPAPALASAVSAFRAIDSESGLSSDALFGLRLREEMARADHGGRSFSLGLLEVVHRHGESGGNGSHHEGKGTSRSIATRDVTRVAHLMREVCGLRSGETLGWLRDGVFVVVLPDEPIAAARKLLAYWQAAIGSALDGSSSGAVSSPMVSSGVCEYRNGRFVGDEDTAGFARMMTELCVDGDTGRSDR